MKRFIAFSLFVLSSLFCFAQGVERIIPNIKDAVFTVYAEDEEGDVVSSGSGFFISSSGEGITNFHVLDGASSGSIKDVNGNIFAIKSIIDYNPQYDLIKFKVDNQNQTKYLPLCTTTPLQGEQIISYSTPLGVFENTVSTGVVASLREMVGYESVIQITAPISHGSSGSPVLNTRGEVVGVATFGYEEGQSLNFAVSASQIRKLSNVQNIKVGDMLKSPLETPLVKKANQCAYKGLFDDAIQYLDEELSHNPNNHLALFIKGAIYRENNNYFDALDNFSKACTLDNDDYTYKINFAITLHKALLLVQDKTQELNESLAKTAIAAFLDAIRIDPQRCVAYSRLAYTLFWIATTTQFDGSEEMLNDAKDLIDEAINLGHDPDNYLIRSKINSFLGNNGQALLDCDEAIKYNPTYYQTYLTRADIKIFNMDFIDDGILDAERALALAVDNEEKADVYGMMGMAYEIKAIKHINQDSGPNAKKALDCYSKAVDLHPSPNYKKLYQDLVDYISEYAKQHGGNFP